MCSCAAARVSAHARGCDGGRARTSAACACAETAWCMGSGAVVGGTSGAAAVSSVSASATCLASSPASSPGAAGGPASSALGCSGAGASGAGEGATGGACASSARSSAAASASSTAFTGRPDASVATSTYSCAHAGASGDAIPRPKPETLAGGPQCGAMRRGDGGSSCSAGRRAPPGRLARQSGCTGRRAPPETEVVRLLTWQKGRSAMQRARAPAAAVQRCRGRDVPAAAIRARQARKSAVNRVVMPRVIAFSRLASSAPRRFTPGGHRRAVSRRCGALRVRSGPPRRRQALAQRR